MANIKYQSRTRETSKSGVSTSVVYYGTREEMVALANDHPVGAYESDGQVSAARVYQDGGDIWCCDLKYQCGADGEYDNAPDTTYGKTSATLKGAMLSLLLETAPNYRTNWNYYLATCETASTAPGFWATATNAILSSADTTKYKWLKSASELPMGPDGNGKTWRILKNPEMPGVESREIATYTITESARYRTAAEAGAAVANRLNKIARPSNDFGITGGDWKCDDGSVSWSGKYWLATLTYTRSGDDKGWDKRLYQSV